MKSTVETTGACLYRFHTEGDPALPCTLLLPAAGLAPDRLFVSVHGISRNDREHLRALAPFAISHGVALLVPRFARAMFRDYQRLGRRGHGPRADLALLQAITEVEEMFGWKLPSFDLFGFSGGAQFAHRFALAHPEKVRHLALGSAGWYSWPDEAIPYPRGVGSTSELPVELDLPGLLHKPVSVFVGERDRQRDPSLNTRRVIDRLQGRTRLDRARNWVAAMRQAARERGLASRVELEILPGVGHDFGQMVRPGGLPQRLFQALYAQGRSRQPAPQGHDPCEDGAAVVLPRTSVVGEVA
ncbi:MAG: alpha/beta hydrolase [Gammaproteobacteria bacterium]|nr:MAG: alpha/beta hydrolase [Gammaproteobacteria bacterium]